MKSWTFETGLTCRSKEKKQKRKEKEGVTNNFCTMTTTSHNTKVWGWTVGVESRINISRNIVALQVEKRCTYYHPPQTLSRNKISLLQVEAACCIKLNWRLLFSTNFFNLQQQNFVAWQCLRWVVIRATTLFNLQRNA